MSEKNLVVENVCALIFGIVSHFPPHSESLLQNITIKSEEDSSRANASSVENAMQKLAVTSNLQ